MSEQTLSAPGEAVVLEIPGEQVGRNSRIMSAVADFVIFGCTTAAGAFLGLFIEDALVQLEALAMAEGSKHGNFGQQVMYIGAAIAAGYIILRNVIGISRSGQTIAGKMMRTRIVTNAGENVSVVNGFFIRIGLPVIAICYLVIVGEFLAALGLGFLIVFTALVTGRCLHDIATGTKVVWADEVDEIPSTIHLSEALRRLVDRFGRFGSWFIVPVVLITCFDVIARKAVWTNDDGIRVGIQIWLTENFGRFFDSTLLQEMEWHSHTILFAFVLGYGYINNTHVRVDLLRERFNFRLKAKLEFFGLTFFLIPYCMIVAYFSVIYAWDSYQISEISASQVGLPMRWVIKTLLSLGIFATVAAGVSVWLQVGVALWGPQNIRFNLMTLEWPEEAGSTIEGKERIDLSKIEDELERRARESGHLVEESAARDDAARVAEAKRD
jgi:TRAP-type mannitol/chloroaromatic compound transport system permease small subunit/uncharacterized RDD family membrane protein YckC